MSPDLRAVFEAMPFPCLLLDAHLVMVTANSAYERAVGLSRGQLTGRYIFDVFPDNPAHPGSAAALEDSMRRALASGRAERMELLNYDVQASGRPAVFQERWWTLLNVPVVGADGGVSGVLNVVEDQTETVLQRRRTEEALAAVEGLRAHSRALETDLHERSRALEAADAAQARTAHRLSQVLEAMAVGYLSMDAGWRITYVNAEGQRILGMPHEQLIDAVIWDLFPATVGSDFEANYRRAAATGTTVVFDAYYPAPLDAWYEVRATPEPDGLALLFVDITTRKRAQDAAERVARRARLLGQVSEQLTGTLQGEQAAARLARLVVPDLADWSLVTLVKDDHRPGERRGLHHGAGWHTDPRLREVVERYGATRLDAVHDDVLITAALTSGQPQLLADARSTALAMLTPGAAHDALEALTPVSVLVLPLPGRHGSVGLLSLARTTATAAFTAEEIALARELADRAGLVLDNARLYRQQRTLAEALQRSLLTALPEPDHTQIVARYVPATRAAQVGGDWYDAFLQPDGATMLVIGDVVGHDAEAAAAMGQIRTILRTLGAQDKASPARLLSTADQVRQTLQANVLATAVVAHLEQSPDQRRAGVTTLRWSNAGHPPPAVLHPDGTVEILTPARADLLLGLDPQAPRHDTEVLLTRESTVLLYTDGLIERRDQDLDTGLQRLSATLTDLAGLNLDQLCDQLLTRMLPAHPDDDVALIAVRLHRQDQPRPPEAGPTRLPPDVPSDPDTCQQGPGHTP